MANVVDQFTVKFWNGSFYAQVRFPDGTSQELKSATDINYAGWQAKISAAWDAIQNPPPPPYSEVTLVEATVDDVKAKIAEMGWTAEDLGLTAKDLGL